MTDETAVATLDEGMALEVYGGRPEIREMADRLLVMMPQVKLLGKAGAMALAQVSLAMGLNPFIGEIWAIPQKGGTFAIMPGIKGLRRKAREWCEERRARYHIFLRPPSVDEIEGYALNTGDIVRACELTIIDSFALELLKATGQQLVYTGIGIYKNGEHTKMNPLQVARKRAEADAIKQAFDVPSPVLSTGAPASGPLIDDYGILNEMPSLPSVYLNGDTPAIGDAVDAIGDVFGDDAAESYAASETASACASPPEPAPAETATDPHEWTPEETRDLTNYWRNELVITDEQALEYLGVDKVSEFTGDLETAKKLIDSQIALEAAHEEEQ